jgi:Uma2 family endonuclease
MTQVLLPELPPTQDELPYSDGVPMESERHVLQMTLLIESLKLHWKDRPEGYVGGNMFVHFSLEHVKNQDFRGPDFFAVLRAAKKERKSWVVWEEGRGPDVVVELLSESTAAVHKSEKKQVYQDDLRVPEYFWYDPFSGELAGFRLLGGRYKPIKPDEEGRLHSQKLELWLARKEGTYQGVEAPWLRWVTEEGRLVPTNEEWAAEARQQAAEARQQAAEAQQQAAEAQQQDAEAQQQAAEAQQQAAEAQQQAASERELRRQAEERLRRLEEQLRRLQAQGPPVQS